MDEKAASREAELNRLRYREQELYAALRVLFDLLELYSPRWYDERSHDQAKAALATYGPRLLAD